MLEKNMFVDLLWMIYYLFMCIFSFSSLQMIIRQWVNCCPTLSRFPSSTQRQSSRSWQSDLRATIATHGAYCPKTVPKTAPLHRTAHSPAQRAGHSSNSLPACTQSSRVPSRQQDPSQPVSHPKHTTDSGVTPKVNDIQTTGGIPNYGISEPSSSKAFSECLLEACDPDVPTRAVALRSLTRSVRDGNKEAMENKDKLQTVSETVYIYIY